MQVKNLFTDDNAVSPVIGVILMVAITVILAAVIGAFVLNIGGSQSAAPSTTIQFETQSTSGGTTYIEGTVQGGDPIKTNEVTVQTNEDDVALDDGTYGITSQSELGAGDSIYIYNDGSDTYVDLTDPGSTPSTGITSLDIVWNSPSSDKSSIIASFSA